MAFKDLREYIEKLEEEKEAIKIDEEVDWDLEVGAIISKHKGIPKGIPDLWRSCRHQQQAGQVP